MKRELTKIIEDIALEWLGGGGSKGEFWMTSRIFSPKGL